MARKRKAKKKATPSNSTAPVSTRFNVVFTPSPAKEAAALNEPLKSAAAIVIARLAIAPFSGKALHGALKVSTRSTLATTGEWSTA